jgi:DNA polymerase-1
VTRGDAYALQRDAIPAVVDMELRGLGIDLAEHGRQVEEWSRQLADARQKYAAATGRPPPSKPSEIREWITEVAGDLLHDWKRTTNGELSTAELQLKRLANVASAHPVLVMQAMAKLLSSFGPKLAAYVNPVTGRIHCSYNIAAAKSGRFSATRPNLQQLPSARSPDFRRCIVAGPGRVLICCDWDQIEMRAAAWISADPVLTAVYEQGRDLHRETAARISGAAVVTDEQRKAAKAINFGSIYGIGPKRLVEYAFDRFEVTMTEDEARRSLDAFFATYASLKRWRRDNYNRAQASGVIHIGAGRVVEATWEEGGLTFPKCCDLPIQGACADAMLRAIRLVDRRLRGLDAGLVASVHDELVVESSEAGADRARETLEEGMIEAFVSTFSGAPVRGVTKTGIGRNWLEAKG